MSDCLATWNQFPKLGLIVNRQKKFYVLNDAVRLLDSNFSEVINTGEVLESDFTVRRLTKEEERAFQNRADEHSASR